MFHINPVGSAKIQTEDGRQLQIHYYIEQTRCCTDGVEQIPTYGISSELFVNGQVVDSLAVPDISPSKNYVTDLVDLLVKNAVTPITLKDVIEDYITCVEES